MKKILSLTLALIMLFTMGLTPVMAEDTFGVSYTLPTNLHPTQTKGSGTVSHWIAINQGEVKIVFTQAVNEDSLSGITFKDSQGNEPRGGLYRTAEGNTVTVKFGELTQAETYTLTVPTTVESENGDALSSPVTRTFPVVNKKVLVDVDFSNSIFAQGAVTVANKKLFSTVYDESIVKDLYYYKGGSNLSITADGTLKVQQASSSDVHIGGHFRSNNRLTNAKVVTVVKYAEPTLPTNMNGIGIGALRTSSFGSPGPVGQENGMAYSNLKNAAFTKKDGYYDVTVVSNVKEVSVSGNSVTYNDWYTARDNISDKTVSTDVTDKTFTKDSGASVFTNSASIIKIYPKNTTFEIAKAKQGFFTIPAPLSSATKDGKTLTYVVNTDIDVTKSTASVGDLPATVTYDADTRKLTLSYVGTLTAGQEYDISFKNIVSLDGIKGDSVVKYTATETDTVEKTYSVVSNAYTVDSDELTITVPAGTKSEEFKGNMIVDGDFIVKDALDAEITQDVILKEGTKLVVENGDVYEVVIDFSTQLITATKWEFITDGEASEDLEVFDEASSVKVTFDSEDFTSIDSGSFNNVTLYEKENIGNTVTISNGTFNENVFTFDIAQGTLIAGTSYVLKFSGVKDSIFGQTYDFEKEFSVKDTPHTFSALYTIPNILPSVSKYIGVNQEEIKVYFEEEINPETAENITFEDEDGNAPVGGVKFATSENVVTLKFGELKEEETYKLSIPATLESTRGKTAIAKEFEFETLKKTFADADFSDSTTWPADTYTDTQINEKNKLTAWFKTDANTVATVADGLLNVKNTSSADTYLGVNVGVYMTTAKVVSLMKFKLVSTNASEGTGMGSMWYSQFNTALPDATGAGNKVKPNGDGITYNSFTAKNGFVAEANTGLYDVVLTSEFEERSVTDDMANKIVGGTIEVKDNNSSAVLKNVGADNQYPYNATTAKVSRFAVLKMYKTNEVAYQKIRTGFYTTPKALEESIWDNETNQITYIMNTDIDVSKSTVTGIDAQLDFDSATRKLTVTTVEPIDNTAYNITLNAVSVDGLKFTDTATIYVGVYSIDSETYAIDNTNKKITGVVPGTKKAEFIEKLEIIGGSVIKDAQNEEITEDVILKEGTKIVLGDGTEYTVVFDYSTPLITATKYEFIKDGEASEDTDNVYDSITSIKVSFNASEFTTIDESSFNNVSVYETLNPGNTVAISNGAFASNAYTFNIAGLEKEKNYTIKFTGVKETVFGQIYNFEKTFTAVETPDPSKMLNVLYTIPNILPSVSKYIGVNQEEIKVYFDQTIASGIENITFKDSLGNAPVGGIRISADGNVVTLKFGELKEEETYTLSIPDSLVSTEGKPSAAKNIQFITRKKTFADADFSDATVWPAKEYSAADINATGKLTAWVKANNGKVASMSVADSLLKVDLPAATDTYLGVNVGWMTTAKVVSFVKFKIDKKYSNASGFTMGGMWYGQFNTNVPKTGSDGTFAVAGNGVGYPDVETAFTKDEETGLYDVTITSVYKEKEVSTDLTKKTMDGSVVVKDNNSSKSITKADSNKMTYNFNEDIAKISHFGVLKTYFENDVSYAKIRMGFYTAPAPLGLPTWNKDAKTITYTMNTDIDVLNSTAKVGELPATLSYNEETRELTLTYDGEIEEATNYNVSFADVISKDGLKGSATAVFNTVLREISSANPMNGSKLQAEAGTMTFVFSENVTLDELNENVVFAKATGEKVDVTFTIADDNKTVTMAYPNLENSLEYTLTIPKTYVFGGVSYSYMTTGRNTIKTITPDYQLAPDVNEVSPYIGNISVEFNEPVAMDLAKQYITLKDSATNAAVSINISEKDGVFTAWFPVLTAEKEYVFEISDILLREKCEIKLKALTPAEAITVSPNSGTIIDVNKREITVAFANERTLSDLQAGIRFVDEEGNGPKGGLFIRKDATDPKKAILRFGRLENNKNYRVVISAPISDSEIVFNYMTSGGYAIDVDFEDWETGEIEKPASGNTFTKGGLLFGHAGHALSNSTFTIKESFNGTKYLQIKANSKNKNVSIGYKLAEALESGKLVVEMAVKEGSTSAEGFKSSANSLLIHSSGSAPGSGTNADTTALSSFTTFPTNASGFYEMKAILTKTSETTAIDYYSKDGSLVVEWENKNAFALPIASVGFMKLYSNQSANDTMNLDYVRAYVVKALEAINSVEGFNPKDTQIEIVFSEDLDVETLKNLAIKDVSLKDNKDYTGVALELVSYSDRKAIFNLSEHLSYGTEYEISLNTVKGTGSFEMMTETPIKFKTMDYAIKSTGENISDGVLSVSLTNALNENRTYKVSVVLYDVKGCAIKASSTTGTIEAGQTNSVTVPTGVTEFADKKTYVWDITNGYYIPVK